jgi:hypothetical protein
VVSGLAAAAGRPVVCRRGDLAAGTGQRRGTGLAVWTGRGAPRLHPERILADGSWLSRLDPEGRTGQPVVVRVLE